MIILTLVARATNVFFSSLAPCRKQILKSILKLPLVLGWEGP